MVLVFVDSINIFTGRELWQVVGIELAVTLDDTVKSSTDRGGKQVAIGALDNRRYVTSLLVVGRNGLKIVRSPVIDLQAL